MSDRASRFALYDRLRRTNGPGDFISRRILRFRDTRAADFLNSWIEKAALKQDTEESIYGYVQDFEVAGNKYQRSSFVALTKLEEFGKIVRPHETTLSKAKVDRLNLTKATNAQFGLIFMLYKDEQKIADKIIEKATGQKTLVDFTDEQDVQHRLFPITNKDDINAIIKMMADKSSIIADGHHRYETALNYSRQVQNPAAGYQMIALANTENEGLIVLATHRLVANIENFSGGKLIAALAEDFELAKHFVDSEQSKVQAKGKMLEQMKADCSRNKNAFGVYVGGEAFYVATLRDKKAMDALAPDAGSAWRSLDVAVLHKVILDKLLGLDEEKITRGGNVTYVKDTPTAIDDSIAKVDAGQIQAALLTNPPKMDQINSVADAGEKMPQKSTYFYPKIYTGLTINKL